MMYVLQGTCDPYANPEDNMFVFLGTYQTENQVMQAVDTFELSGYHDFIVTPIEVVNVETNREVA